MMNSSENDFKVDIYDTCSCGSWNIGPCNVEQCKRCAYDQPSVCEECEGDLVLLDGSSGCKGKWFYDMLWLWSRIRCMWYMSYIYHWSSPQLSVKLTTVHHASNLMVVFAHHVIMGITKWFELLSFTIFISCISFSLTGFWVGHQ